MKETMLARSRRLWSNPLAPADLNRKNARKWVKAVRRLGDKWLLAKPLERQSS